MFLDKFQLANYIAIAYQSKEFKMETNNDYLFLRMALKPVPDLI